MEVLYMKSRVLFVVLLVVAIAALFLAGCTSSTSDENTAAPQPVEKIDVKKEIIEETPVVIAPPVVPSDAELLSLVVCQDKKIMLTLTNTQSSDLLVKDVEFRLNAALDPSPDCDSETLTPGQSTVCSGLDVVPLGRQPVVQVRLKNGEQMVQKALC